MTELYVNISRTRKNQLFGNKYITHYEFSIKDNISYYLSDGIYEKVNFMTKILPLLEADRNINYNFYTTKSLSNSFTAVEIVKPEENNRSTWYFRSKPDYPILVDNLLNLPDC